MEPNVKINISIYSRRWGAISLLENISKRKRSKEKHLSEPKQPKRLKTDFFPNRFKGRRRYREQTYFLISPESLFKLFITFVKILLLVTEAILIPFILTFSPDNIQGFQLSIEIIEFFFFIDMILKFNTEVYINGNLYSKRSEIALNYAKNWLFLDFVSVFPFHLFIHQMNFDAGYLYISATNSSVFKFLWLLKLLRLPVIKVLIYEVEDFFVSSVLLGPIHAFKFFCTAFIWTHWLACLIYAYYARGLEEKASLWNIFLDDPGSTYLKNIYLVVETMTSVGYGDILPVTLNQHIIAIISMCFACVLFGNIIGNIQGFIENYGADDKFYESTARKLKNYLKQNDLPIEFRHRVIQYIYYLKNISKNNSPKEMSLLKSLSAPLREEIFTQTRGYLLAKSAVFRSYSGAFLKSLGHQMKIEVFAPGDQIFKEGEMSNVIYYLCMGKVQIYHESTKTVFKDIKKNKYFGEISFFLDTCRTASAMCLQFAEFLTLDRNTFFKILQSRPKEIEITNVIIYNTDKYKNLSLLGVRCYLCRKMGHVAKNCVDYIYIPDNKLGGKIVEAKKHNVKKINIENMCQVNFKREPLDLKPFKNYDIYNTKGKPFTPGIKYFGNQGIITKAWRVEPKKSNLIIGERMNNISEASNESDSEDANNKINDYLDSSGGESVFALTFGNKMPY